MNTLKRLLGLAVALASICLSVAEYKMVCYHTNWSQYRNGAGKFLPEDIDANLCTHAVYAFARVTNGILAPFEWNDKDTSWSKGMYTRFNDLKKINRNLKTLLAVGGWTHSSDGFTEMVATVAKRKNFIDTSIAYLKETGFDGLDLDWEYPAVRGNSPPEDKQNFVELVKELRVAFELDAIKTGGKRLLLTAAVGVGKETAEKAYDIPQLVKYFDFINLMTYDLRGAWEKETGHHSALYARTSETGDDLTLNVDWAVQYWKSQVEGAGYPASKLVLGTAMYGRSFTLASNTPSTGMAAPAKGAGSPGSSTGEGGFLAYYEICDMLRTGGKSYYDAEHQVPYAIKGDQWVGYDDKASMINKIDYMRTNGLGGMMIWSLALDDFTGSFCGQGKYPLLTALNSALYGGTMPTAGATTINVATKPTTTVSTNPGTTRPTRPSLTSTPTTKRPTTTPRMTSTTTTKAPVAEYKMVCYHTNWSQYRNGAGKFLPEDTDANLCTHAVYAFARVTNGILAPFEWNDKDTSWSKGMYTRFNDLKKINRNLKTLLAVGGWTHSSAGFTEMVATVAKRKNFIDTSIAYLKETGFDGLDLDWEYPAVRGNSPPEDKQNFVELVKELRVAFELDAIKTGGKRLLLTAAVGVGKETAEKAYDIPQLVKYFDFINLMTYDLRGAWKKETGHHSALYARTSETGDDLTLNVDWAVQYWKSQVEGAGYPASKLVLGTAMYGRSFTLASNTLSTGMAAPAKGAGSPGSSTGEGGFLAYYEICDMLRTGGKSYYDPEHQVPYAIKGDQWVGYDDEASMINKIDYMRTNGLGGMMIWSLALDDFTGSFCGQGKYPLLTALNSALYGGTMPTAGATTINVATKPTTTVSTKPGTTRPTRPSLTSTPTTKRPTTTPRMTSTTTTKAPGTSFTCAGKTDGIHADPFDCTIFHQCAHGRDYITGCPPGLLFNSAILVCDWPANVSCRLID